MEIELKEKTVNRLNFLKHPSKSYDDLINYLIEFLLINTPQHSQIEKDFGVFAPTFGIVTRKDVDKFFRDKGVK